MNTPNPTSYLDPLARAFELIEGGRTPFPKCRPFSPLESRGQLLQASFVSRTPLLVTKTGVPLKSQSPAECERWADRRPCVASRTSSVRQVFSPRRQ
jgi:hypothetical protein